MATLVQYEDEDKDKIVLASDGDLVAAVHHAKQAGWKVSTLQKTKPTTEFSYRNFKIIVFVVKMSKIPLSRETFLTSLLQPPLLANSSLLAGDTATFRVLRSVVST